MKKNIIAILTAIIVLLGGSYGITQLGGNINQVVIDSLTYSATTTGSFASTLPVKIAPIDYGRQYMAITNTDATNNIYIYATTTELGYNFTGALMNPNTSATSTLSNYGTVASSTLAHINPKGILIAPKTTYEITEDNMIVGEIWSTSTSATGIQINVNTK